MSFVCHPFLETITVQTVPLAAIPEAWTVAWESLAQSASEPAPFAESWFLKPSIIHLQPPADAHMVTVWQGPVLIGMIALCTGRRYGRMPVRHTHNWQHFHALSGTPLVRADCESAFWSAVLGELDSAGWAPSFLHLTGFVAGGPLLRALMAQRRADVVHRVERAFLQSDLTPAAYYEANIRKKKRKEIARLRLRLGEVGAVEVCRFSPSDRIDDWIADFLTLEASGWKGRSQSALVCDHATARFFGEAIRGAASGCRLEILKMTVDGVPIAMLVNFITAPGSFSYKIAFDENYARSSPGVLIQIENLQILADPDVAWMDSCAVEDHSMINSIWAERREIVRVTVPLKGRRRKFVFKICRTLEELSAAFRNFRSGRQ